MESPCSTTATTAQRLLARGREALAQKRPRAARRAFGQAVRQQPAMAQTVGDIYDGRAAAALGPGERRGALRAAKTFYRRQADSAAEAPTQAAMLQRVADIHGRMSRAKTNHYDAHHNARALAYYDQALARGPAATVGVAAREGRFRAQADRFGSRLARPWYRIGKRFDAAALAGALGDAAWLLGAPSSPELTRERLLACTQLVKHRLDARGQDIVHKAMLPGVAGLLQASPTAAPDLTQAALGLVAALAQEQSWLSPALYPQVRALVHGRQLAMGELTLVLQAYEAMLQSSRPLAGDILRDLAKLRSDSFGSREAMGMLLKTCQHFIEQGCGEPAMWRGGIAELLALGQACERDDGVGRAIEQLTYCAEVYTTMAPPAIAALAALAVHHAAIGSPHAALVRLKVLQHLLSLQKSPDEETQKAAQRALAEQLQVTPAELQEPA